LLIEGFGDSDPDPGGPKRCGCGGSGSGSGFKHGSWKDCPKSILNSVAGMKGFIRLYTCSQVFTSIFPPKRKIKNLQKTAKRQRISTICYAHIFLPPFSEDLAFSTLL
jgi:hypothetical protein